MKVIIKQSDVLNIIYHFLAHLDIEHPSNIYDAEYIKDYKLHKAFINSDYSRVDSFVQKNIEYQENFSELAAINFIPFQANSILEACDLLNKYSGNTSKRSKAFINEFNNLIKFEKDTYLEWKKEPGVQYKSKLEKTLLEKRNPLNIMQNVLNLDIEIYLIDSLFHYGRAYVNEDRFVAGVLNPRNDKEVDHAVMIVLHEMIHCITDTLVNEEEINDSGISLKERLVMVFEKLYINEFYNEWSNKYMEMLNEWHPGVTHDNLITKFDISNKYMECLNGYIERMKSLINQN